jgi:hypothetical protein
MKILKNYKTKRQLRKEIQALKSRLEEIARERDRWMSQTF